MKNLIAVVTSCALIVALAGCSTFGPAKKTPKQLAKANYICDAKDLQALLGEQANANTGAVALKKSFAKELRWIPSDSAVTMDYREDRLNISYNQDMIIDRVNCR